MAGEGDAGFSHILFPLARLAVATWYWLVGIPGEDPPRGVRLKIRQKEAHPTERPAAERARRKRRKRRLRRR